MSRTTDTRLLLSGLIKYKERLEKHLDQLGAEYIQLENRWRYFKASSEGDYIDQFQAGWALTEANFKSYIDQAQKVKILLNGRIDNLNQLNQGRSEIDSGKTMVSPSNLQFTPINLEPSPSEPEPQKEPWGKEHFGIFNQASVENVDSNLKGIYHIYSSDGMQYIGKSDDCIRGRLKCHLTNSTNKLLKAAVQSGTEFVFSCWESPDPKYEEAIEIKRMKGAALLKGQRNEKKPLIEYLD
jgi:predicted GIY-YIG superfamily endonuclease